MSDWQYFCPRCEEAIAKWDFSAPPDYYRCFVCGLATPFKDLPRRNVLKSWASVPPTPPIPVVIDHGTGLENSSLNTITIGPFSCLAGSTLVVPVARENDGGALITSVTWGSLTETIPDASVTRAVFNTMELDTYSFKNVPAGSGTLVVTFSIGFDAGLACAIEVTQRPSLDVFTTSSGSSTTLSVGPTSSLSVINETAVAALFTILGAGESSTWASPFTGLQSVEITTGGLRHVLITSWNRETTASAQTASYGPLPGARNFIGTLTTFKP